MIERSTSGFSEAVHDLLRDRGWTQKRLARAACVDPGFLSRVLHGHCPPSPELAARVEDAFELPCDFFPERREHAVIQAIRRDPVLRDRIYERLAR
ncbi:MAG: helix-turn-helix transcriptional regulator [Thermoleophilia bacterium]|nr:helix-turn-helix transcriptional regulator [Thermoleophilia bacterium]